ncbi:sodium:solute symporter [Saccharopolyspora sp. HNM0983]|uniref:Sodium:solute symporter n=1 Tax=Saccharopolyspora montiporae TaxID=2781240 RepID=A0A929BAW0_9PSEU|nr:sodium:solute symporter [Saccharopolyspora sp. HNM0983]MBE9376487.1 sodium:solute symporter [Saccharopolyspora sp. HNM0983]
MGADYAVVGLYVLAMLAAGWYGMRLARTRTDYLVAGRSLGPITYAGTMSAVVLGGASTIGGVGLGYAHGISGAWLVLTIGLGIFALHAVFARRLVRLRLHTVSELLDLRYGGSTGFVAGAVMWGYTLMLTVTSVLAFSTVFSVFFDMPRPVAVALGGGIVVCYASLGGMWSITLTDMAQFWLMTAGFLFVLLPLSVSSAGGFAGMRAELDAAFFDPLAVGGGTILTYVLVYGFGLLIGQDIWQRVFTARSEASATGGGIGAAVYCAIFAVSGALVGTAARAMYPGLGDPDDAFATIVADLLPVGVRGLVLAAALSALMSTASGALIACSTVSTHDLLPKLGGPAGGVRTDRIATVVLGALAIGISAAIGDVVAALTVAYNVLVGGLLVAVLGGLLWRRGTRAAALASTATGAIAVIAAMIVSGVDANSPIYLGLGASLVVYVVVSLCTPSPPEHVLRAWDERISGVREQDPTARTTAPE